MANAIIFNKLNKCDKQCNSLYVKIKFYCLAIKTVTSLGRVTAAQLHFTLLAYR